MCIIPIVVRINTYSWGSNSNVTLGHEMSKQYPQKLKMLTNYGIKQVCCVCVSVYGAIIIFNGFGHGLLGMCLKDFVFV